MIFPTNGFISTHLDSINAEFYTKVHGNSGVKSHPENIGLIQKGVENCLKFGKDPESMVNCITFTKPLADGDAKKTIEHMFTKYGIKTCLTLFNPVVNRTSNDTWTPSL